MGSFCISIPYFESLRRPHGWSRTPDSDRGFNVVRFHYYFKRRSDIGRLYSGAPIADISVAPGVVREDTEVWAGEYERVDTTSTATSLVVAMECATKLATELKVAAGVPGSGSVDAHTLAEATTAFRREASEQLTTSTSIRRTARWQHTQKLTVDGSKSEGPLYVVSQYRHVGYDVYLAAIDYLFIDYEQRRIWKRRRRVKDPACEPERDWLLRPNVLRSLNVPMRTIHVWELADVRNPVVGGEYEPDVGDPSEVQVSDLLVEGPSYQFPIRDVRSLYHYANHAFPHKWNRNVGRLGSSHS